MYLDRNPKFAPTGEQTQFEKDPKKIISNSSTKKIIGSHLDTACEFEPQNFCFWVLSFLLYNISKLNSEFEITIWSDISSIT